MKFGCQLKEPGGKRILLFPLLSLSYLKAVCNRTSIFFELSRMILWFMLLQNELKQKFSAPPPCVAPSLAG